MPVRRYPGTALATDEMFHFWLHGFVLYLIQ